MSKRRFSKQDWITLGLQALSTGGSEAVKLEAICKAAGLTRGSFYHHFEDHESFLTGLALFWLESQTAEVSRAVDPQASAEEQNAALTKAAMEIDYRLELGMRELGRRLPEIDRIIKQADAIRLETISGIYQRRFGLKAETADGLAHIEYAAFSGIILLDPDISHARQTALADLYERTILRALGKETGA